MIYGFWGLRGFDDTFMGNGIAGIKWEDLLWMAFSGIMMNGSWEIMDGLYSLGSVTTELHDGTNNDKTALLFLQERSLFSL